ncbi:MAG: shikimate kinase [Nitrospiraceae bacterium]|nr:shikimate kinase [Nitrospiraceae bacterium]|tara:strand:- start:666 stop:1229 length:564 start_codon:yes stop_codon:yes gene_type:complete
MMGYDSSIVIVGFMGTGKTVVGSVLAKELGVRFFDTDRLIEEAQGMLIADIFSRDGEEVFRTMEKQTVRNVVSSAKREPCIIATGGGTVVDVENLQRLKTIGLMVCLYADPEVIHARTVDDACRPLLPTGETVDRLSAIVELLAVRRPFYESADICIDTSQHGVNSVVTSVIDHINSIESKRLNCLH